MMKRTRVSALLIAFLSLLMLDVSAGIVQAEEVKKILSIEAYDMLNTVPDTYLIDVRTRPEYQFVGHAPNAYLFPYAFFNPKIAKKDDIYEYSFSEKNKDFVDEISKVFKKTDNLLIISRDGTRSALAAKDLIDAGFKKVFDVGDGFLQELGEETLLIEREFNRRAGFTNKDDRLPEWMTREHLPPHDVVFDVSNEDLDSVFHI